MKQREFSTGDKVMTWNGEGIIVGTVGFNESANEYVYSVKYLDGRIDEFLGMDISILSEPTPQEKSIYGLIADVL